MASEENPHYFATNTKDDTNIDQITDAVDFPHTGLIKALSLGMKGNYAVKGSATDFDITQASSSNVLQVAEGKIYRDGAFHPVSAANFTSSSFQATANTHHLLVANSSNVLQIRKHGSSTQNKIPPYDEGDTIIAVVTYTSDGFNDMTIQYLTTGKVANNVSIGYDNSGYDQTMSITGGSGKTTLLSEENQVVVKLNGTSSSNTFQVTDSADQLQFAVNGDGTATIAGATTLSSIAACGSDTDKFLVSDSGVIKFRTGAEVRSDIGAGTSSVAALNDLSDVSYSSGDLTITSLDKIVYANGGNAELSVTASGSGTVGRDLTISAGSTTAASGNTDGGDLILKSGLADGTGSSFIAFHTSTATSDDAVAERMRIHTDGNVSIGTASPDANAKLTVEGAISLDEISAPSNTADRGQLYTNADNHLHFINGAGTDVKVTEEVFIVALSDETTDLTTGTGKASFHMPFAMTLTGVKANCTTAPVGATIIVDINEAGSTILSTKLSIDASELTSSTAASAAVMSDTALADDALITFDIDQVGSSTAGKGLKVTLYGYRA